MKLESYQTQRARWPQSGRHILAHYDDVNIVVYQAYRESIGRYAAEHQSFGGDFIYSRMSWIKPNFLWMMYRSGWGAKEGQEVTLAVTIRRDFFDEILAAAVPSSFTPSRHTDHEAWKRAVADSDVRLQWDPDHAPNGKPLERKAVQLGLRGDILRRYGTDEVVSILDLSDFVAEQRANLTAPEGTVETPFEEVYVPTCESVARSIGLDVSGD